MKQSKYSEEQIISIFREAEKGEQTITAICRAHSISENTFQVKRAPRSRL